MIEPLDPYTAEQPPREVAKAIPHHDGKSDVDLDVPSEPPRRQPAGGDEPPENCLHGAMQLLSVGLLRFASARKLDLSGSRIHGARRDPGNVHQWGLGSPPARP